MIKNTFFRFLCLVSLCCAAPLTVYAEKLKIVTEGANPPFSTIDNKGQLQGFDVDIAKAICAKMSADCEISAQDFDGIIPALLAKKYDAVVASLNITDDRKKVVAFSKPYYRSPSVFIGKKGGAVTVINASALTGKSIGVQSGTNHSAYVEDKFTKSKPRLYNTIADAYRDLIVGRIDYVLYDKLAAYDWLQHDEGACCQIVGADQDDASYFGSGVGIAFRKNEDALANRINAALDAIIADGTYAAISKKYFPFPIL